MYRAVVLPFVFVALLSPALAGDLPLRKAGRWELKTVMDEGGQKHEQAMTMCVDADMERNTALASNLDHKKSCAKYEVKKAGSTVIVEATCTMNGRDVESRTEMSGDFQNAFKVTIDSTTSGIEGTQTMSIKRTITQDGKYLGESCGELKGGEAMGSDGSKILVQ